MANDFLLTQLELIETGDSYFQLQIAHVKILFTKFPGRFISRTTTSFGVSSQ